MYKGIFGGEYRLNKIADFDLYISILLTMYQFCKEKIRCFFKVTVKRAEIFKKIIKDYLRKTRKLLKNPSSAAGISSKGYILWVSLF